MNPSTSKLVADQNETIKNLVKLQAMNTLTSNQHLFQQKQHQQQYQNPSILPLPVQIYGQTPQLQQYQQQPYQQQPYQQQQYQQQSYQQQQYQQQPFLQSPVQMYTQRPPLQSRQLYSLPYQQPYPNQLHHQKTKIKSHNSGTL